MEEMKNLVELLNKHSYNYYVLDNPTISDGEYDRLYDKLVELEKQTGIVLPNSPTHRVGDTVLKGFKKVTHKVKLYSLNKCQSTGELKDWILSVKEKEPKASFSLEYKFDGLTIVCTYKNGQFVSASTRGNGTVGEDVTNQVKTIKSVPKQIDFKGELIVQGEGMMTLSNLDKYNKENPNEPLKNARNAVSGAIRNLDPKQTAKRNLDWFCYNICYAENMSFDSQEQMREFLTSNGFLTSEFFFISNDENKIIEKISQIDKEKSGLNILIDGMVIKLNQVSLREDFGWTSKFPKWAMAFKFEAEEVTSELKNVVWQVGRTGKLTPIAEVAPVELAGATVTRATLNNYGDILRKRVEIGSTVFIRRSNEVIPEILGLAESFENSQKVEKPICCPSCGSSIIEVGANLFCPNVHKCPEQIVDRITHFSTRDAMNIEGFSEQTALLLLNNFGVDSVDKLYTLTPQQLMSLEGFKEKKVNNLLNSLEKSKDVKLANFIYALGINGVGKKTAKDLAKKFKNINNLKSATVEDFSMVRDVGEIIAVSVYEFFHDEYNLEVINKLLSYGVKLENEQDAKSSIFENTTFVLTGTLETLSRAQATQIIEENGGNVSSSVSSKTSYVLAGESAGSKLDKAKKLNITIIDEKEFLKMVKN